MPWKAGEEAKRSLNIRAMKVPTYSPDLNPLDFAVWKDIETRILEKKRNGDETRTSYISRLRRTAQHTKPAFLRKSLMSMKKKIKQVIEAKGAPIASD